MAKAKCFVEYDDCIKCKVICDLGRRFMRYPIENTKVSLDALYEIYSEHVVEAHREADREEELMESRR